MTYLMPQSVLMASTIVNGGCHFAPMNSGKYQIGYTDRINRQNLVNGEMFLRGDLNAYSYVDPSIEGKIVDEKALNELGDLLVNSKKPCVILYYTTQTQKRFTLTADEQKANGLVYVYLC